METLEATGDVIEFIESYKMTLLEVLLPYVVYDCPEEWFEDLYNIYEICIRLYKTK